MKMRKYLAFVMLPAIILVFSTNKAQAFVFGSDVHAAYQVESNGNLNNLANLLGYFWGDDGIGLVGDQARRESGTPFQLQTDYYAIMSVIANCSYIYEWENYPTVYTSKGNHDLSPSDQSFYKTYDLDYADYPSPYDNNNLEVFAINSDYFNNSTTPGILNTWLYNQRSNGKIKVIMSHFPLHTKRTGYPANWYPTAQAQTDIYNVIDNWTKASGSDRTGGALDIVFLWGHNHDAQLQQNENIDKIATPGETMAISYNSQYNHVNASKTLNFTYLNAGFVSGDDGGHMSQIVPLPTCLYILRYGQNGYEDGAFLMRKNPNE